MNLKLEIEFSKANLLLRIDGLKKRIDDIRPLPADVEGRVMQKLRLEWNYNSNAIEGNKLSYGETTALLMHGITAKGKPLKDHLDIQGHNKAIDFLFAIIKEGRPFLEIDIRDLHQIILVEPYQVSAKTADGQPTTKQIKIGAYKTSANHVETSTGLIYYYASPEETPAKMQELMEWYNEASQLLEVHPAILAALFHYKFVAIHPFDDGNGRMSRILMNLILMKSGYPPVVIKTDDRQNYYALLSAADAGEHWPFVEYIVEGLERSMNLYLNAAAGGDIDEEEDIDKEIALLRMQTQPEVFNRVQKSKEVINNALKLIFEPLTTDLFIKASKFDEFFVENSKYLHFQSEMINIQSKTFDERIYDSINNQFECIIGIEIVLRYLGFKNLIKNFDIIIYLRVTFNQFNYEIKENGQTILTKFYEEPIFPYEKKQFEKAVMEVIKHKIQLNLTAQKNPEL